MSHRQEQKEAARAAREAAEREEAARASKTRRLRLLGAIGFIVVAIVAIVLVAGGGGDDGAGTTARTQGAGESRSMLEGIPQDGTTLGSPDAKLVLTEFADLQCPFCRDFAVQVLPTVIDRYVRSGQLRLELRLLRFIGADSDRGARAAHAAAAQDKMWDFVDLWYRNQGAEGTGYADDDFISGLAEAAGMTPGSAIKAIEDGAHEQAITTAELQAQTAGINSTPSFLIGEKGGEGRKLEPADLTPEAFEAALAPELEK